MTKLFQPSGSTTTPVLPALFVPAPDGTDRFSPAGEPVTGKVVTLPVSGGWQVVR